MVYSGNKRSKSGGGVKPNGIITIMQKLVGSGDAD